MIDPIDPNGRKPTRYQMWFYTIGLLNGLVMGVPLGAIAATLIWMLRL